MNHCSRCRQPGDVWGSLDIQSRYGDFAVPMLCRACTQLAITIFTQGDTMTDLIDLSTDDVDDAEHLPTCACPECDPDIRFEYQRELQRGAA